MLFVCSLALCFLYAVPALAGGRNPADYPLRVHIYQVSAHSLYSNQMLTTADGEGRANLFENSEPRGFDFSYSCGVRLQYSDGYETYPARWKKQGSELEILVPEFGKPNTFDSCNLKVDMKDFAYHTSNGLKTEPVERYKQWMDRVQYDPEHGKSTPQEPASNPEPAAKD
jgi:hypothetical protein